MLSQFLPVPTPETQHFWDGCKAGELRLQRCVACQDSYFPPRPFCPKCGSREVEVYRASGNAILWSYVINHLPRADFGSEPYAIAVVKLDEGPMMMTNIVDCPQTPEALQLDMPLQAAFGKRSDEITLPLFAPARP
ncbi:MAG: Zn-ribbon domain-containing OB-fold protein [Niveispirillum sp.]|uniref:Zn-ribbon domain-containing OB-fold protein n=1 Tax=Niveispirillum sp. TaxID=1917217 RepID=UPI004036C23C